MDTNQYPNSERAIDITNGFYRFQSLVLDVQDESDFDDIAFGNYPSITFPLVAAQRDYALDQTEYIIAIKKFSITYDGTNWYEATPIDTGEMTQPTIPQGTAAEVVQDGQFSKISPKFDFRYGSVFVYPMATQSDVDAGAKVLIEPSREISPITSSDITTGTRIPGIDSAFHPLLYLYPAFDMNAAKGRDGRLTPIKARIDILEAMARRQYSKKVKARRMNLIGINKWMK